MFDDEEEESFEDRRDRVKSLPIYKKGKEILRVVREIGELIPDDDENLAEIRSVMYEDAMLLSVKVAGAEAGNLYDIRMECASII